METAKHFGSKLRKTLAALLATMALMAVLLPGALAVDLNVDVGFYFKQSRGGTCTLASAAMMLRRRAYLDDFRKTQNGDYQYEGSRYACELSEKEWKKQSTAMAAAGIAVILLTIAAGCVPSVGLQGSIFVLLPYAVQLAAACSLAWACARLLGKEYPLREYVYQQTVCKISLRSGVCIAAAGVSVIGELVELTRHSNKILFSIPFLLTEVVMGVAALVLLKNVKKYTWKRVRL